MYLEEIKENVKNIVSRYVDITVKDDDNLLVLTPVRNLIYILFEIEEKFKISIDSTFISEVKYFSVNNLEKIINKYLNDVRIQHCG